jgi:integrase
MAMQRGTRWQGSAMVNGERKRLSFKSLQEAERFEADPYSYLKVTEDTNEIGTIFPQWARHIWGKTRNEKNALRITDELVKRLGRRRTLRQIDRATVRELTAELRQEGNADGTINTKIGKLSRLLDYAIEEGMLTDRPKIKLLAMPEGRVRSLSPDEEKRLFAGLQEKNRYLAQFLLYTGCRYGEAINLKWDDVGSDTVTFWKTKTDRPRTVPLTKQAAEAIAYARAQEWKKPFGVFVYATFRNQWNTARKRAGLAHDKQVIPHILRHTCATRLAQGGMDPMRMMMWLGHSNMKTTMRYTHMNVNDLRKGASVLETVG